jgi:WD40 repeat protein
MLAQVDSNPFVGPQSLAEHNQIFGRDREIACLRDMVVAERLILLFGPSGCGKTSLINAGLIPELRIHCIRCLRVARLDLASDEQEAGNESNRYLLSVCASALGMECADFAGQSDEQLLLKLTDGINSDGGSAACSKQPVERALLVLDAFERLFTLVPDDIQAKIEFLVSLEKLTRMAPQLFVVIAMREEFIARLEEYVRPFSAAARFRLGLLDGHAAVSAIKGPALRAGYRMSDSFAQQLARNLAIESDDDTAENDRWASQPLIEPLYLQLACRRFWREGARSPLKVIVEQEEPPATLTDEQRGTLGFTVDHALLSYYEETIEAVTTEFSIPQRTLRDFVARKLITQFGHRDQVWADEAEALSISPAALRALEDSHLLRGEQRGKRIAYELSHDRLATPIQRTHTEWLRKNLLPFQALAESWSINTETRFLSHKEIRDAHSWIEKNPRQLTGAEAQYLKLSVDRLKARKRVLWIGAIATVLIGVLVGSGLRIYEAMTAQQRRDTAIEQERSRRSEAERAEQARHTELAKYASDAAYAARVGDLDRAGKEARAALAESRAIEQPNAHSRADVVAAGLVEWFANRFSHPGRDVAEPAGGAPQTSQQGTKPYTALALSADRRWIALSRSYTELQIHDSKERKTTLLQRPAVGSIAVERVFLTGDNAVPQLYVQAKGGFIWRATHSRNDRAWRAPSQILRCRGLKTAAISSDGEMMVYAWQDGTIPENNWQVGVHDLARGGPCMPTTIMSNLGNPVDTIVISPQKRWIAIGGTLLDKVHLFEVTAGGLARVPDLDTGSTAALAFDVDESKLAVAEPRGFVRIFRLGAASGTKTTPLTLPLGTDTISDIAFLDSEHLVIADETPVIRVWDLTARRPTLALLRKDTAPTRLAVVDDGSLYSAGQDGVFQQWPSQSLADTGIVDLEPHIQAFCERRAAKCSRQWMDATLPRAIAIRPGLQEVAIGYVSGDVFTYSLASKAITRHIEPVNRCKKCEVIRLAYSWNGEQLALGNGVGNIAVYADSNPVPIYRGSHKALVSGLVFVPGTPSQRLASASFDGRIGLHDLIGGQPIFSRDVPPGRVDANDEINSLAYDHSGGQLIATMNAGPHAWSLANFPTTEEKLPSLPEAAGKIIWADKRDDMLVDAGFDGIQRVHDLRSNPAQTRALPRYHSRIFRQLWEPEGTAILSLSADAVIRAYDVVRGRELFAIRLPASRSNEFKDFRALDMVLACTETATTQEHTCLLAATLGEANRISLFNIQHAR